MALFVSYLRVSTEHQGADGHGIASQNHIVAQFIERERGTLVAAFVEVASGRREDRPQMLEAVRRCKALGARLLVARGDRLTREPAILRWLEKEGVEWVDASSPHASDDQKDLEAALGKIMARRIRVATKLGLCCSQGAWSEAGWLQGRWSRRPATRQECRDAAHQGPRESPGAQRDHRGDPGCRCQHLGGAGTGLEQPGHSGRTWRSMAPTAGGEPFDRGGIEGVVELGIS